jgi:hypothetical protein
MLGSVGVVAVVVVGAVVVVVAVVAGGGTVSATANAARTPASTHAARSERATPVRFTT